MTNKSNIFRVWPWLISLMLVLILTGVNTTPAKSQSTEKQEITQRDYENSDIEMADAWRSNGKIYVVVATISAILIGVFAYLIWLDRRVAKMEEQINNPS